MDRIVSIVVSIFISLLMYQGFVVALRTERGRAHLCEHWIYHPNAICIWRVVIGLGGTVLYFVSEQYLLGILLFTISAVLDGVDGLIARSCDLVTPFGEQVDPLCDKLTYLPPMVFFAYKNLLGVSAVWALVIIEALGQFFVRYVIKRFTNFSVAANNFGKIKAVLCFALIIYVALLDGALRIPNFANQMLQVCIILSLSSILFKLIPNRFYADILSILNLLCGLTGIILVVQGRNVYAAIAILAGQIFDLFDGRMAEKHGGTKYGPWLDDIADLTSFGVCPGLLVFFKGEMGVPSIVVGAFYFLAIGFRLWRYLAYDKKDAGLRPGEFNGLPSPAGAVAALGACLFWSNLWIVWATILLTSFLLISHLRFVHFGRVILNRLPRTFIVLLGFVIVLIIAYMIKAKDSEMLGALLLLGFLLYAMISSKIVLGRSS